MQAPRLISNPRGGRRSLREASSYRLRVVSGRWHTRMTRRELDQRFPVMIMGTGPTCITLAVKKKKKSGAWLARSSTLRYTGCCSAYYIVSFSHVVSTALGYILSHPPSYTYCAGLKNNQRNTPWPDILEQRCGVDQSTAF